MNWNRTTKMNNPFSVGSDRDGKTIVVGNPENGISHIILEGDLQIKDDDIISTLHRLGEINELKNSDYQKAILKLFSE